MCCVALEGIWAIAIPAFLLVCCTGGYAVVLDINLLAPGIEKLMLYLREAAFLDRVATSSLKVRTALNGIV